MPKRITFALQKGGVGKTSSTVVTAEVLSASGYKVLVVDFDSQGNATKMLTKDSIYKFTGHTIMEAIRHGDAAPYIVTTESGVDLIPAEDNLAAFSRYIYTAQMEKPYKVLQRLLEPIESAYDFVFVDVGPSLGDTMINTLVYSDFVVVPVDLGDLSMDAMVRFINFIEETKSKGHVHSEIAGILLTMRDSRSRYERDISQGIREAYGELVFISEIRRRTKIKEFTANGVNINEPAMIDYMNFVEELIIRISNKQ